MFVEAFIAHGAVKALDEGILVHLFESRLESGMIGAE